MGNKLGLVRGDNKLALVGGTNEMIDQKLEYIHLNSVTAGFVDQPEAWLYSSARDYTEISKGPIDLIFI